MKRFVLLAVLGVAPFIPVSSAYAAPANAWHIPWQAGGEGCLGGIDMRNPHFEIGPTSTVFVYSGVQKWMDASQTNVIANQTGGTLWYKAATGTVWSSKGLGFDNNCGANQYWKESFSMTEFDTADVVEYYLELTFDTPGVSTTYLHGADSLSTVSTNRTDAEADPHSIRNRSAFIFHGNDRVVVGNDVTFRAKLGYITQNQAQWADTGRLYYTTNGVEPDGALGVAGNASTLIATMVFDNIVMDFSIAGEGMEFSTTVTNLPKFDLVKYKMGFWHSDNDEEKFAEYRAGVNDETFSFQLATPGDPVLTVNGQNAEYTTTKFFINENEGEKVPFTMVYDLSTVAADIDPNTVEIFGNIDRRRWVTNDWNLDGVEDGILQPDFNTIFTTNFMENGGSYFAPRAMVHQGGNIYTATGVLRRCGAYRVTARYRTNGADHTDWEWYPPNFADAAQAARAHAVVLSPKKALEMTLYELNTTTIEATSPDSSGRSTFDDLLGAPTDNDGFDPFNLDFLNKLQVNCLWFQPIHPNGLVRTEQADGSDPCVGANPYDPGSPYATRNYFAVLDAMGDADTEADALEEFTNFVAQCDVYTGSVGTVNVMLDFVANHTSWDAVFGQGAVDLGFTTNINNSTTTVVQATDPIGLWRPYWYADDNGGSPNYCDEADFYSSPCNNDWTAAPDRGDFGQWQDVAELYFGRYSALVCTNPNDNDNYKNETDAVDYIGSMTPGVIEVWRYFGYYPEFWLKQTGHPGSNTGNPEIDKLGIDALRCDFGQGLPPQCWEYVINRTRNFKWDMVFMAETLDGGIPGYRSNRHFDILNESLVFQFTQAQINDSQQLMGALESRRAAYNGGAILLNLTSHDEIMPDDDPWVTAARYASVSSVQGLPMIFYGQENGIGRFDAGDPDGAKDGFASHELNFGKYVPHFKRFNQLQVWTNAPFGSDGLCTWYGQVNWARLNSPALRSKNQWFLDLTGGGRDARIFAAAKYQHAGGSPSTSDVVLAFSRFIEHGLAHAAAANTFDLRGGGDALWNLLGMNTNKLYTVRNMASSDAFFLFTNGWPQTGAQLYNNGLFVGLNAGAAGGSITNDGEVVQYLKVVELDETTPYDSDNDGLFDGWEHNLLGNLDSNGNDDDDGDGMLNKDEFASGTHPDDPQSFFAAKKFADGPIAPSRMITVATEPGKKYTVQYADGNIVDGMTWSEFANPINGCWVETSQVSTNYTFIDLEDTDTTGSPPVSGVRNYRVLVSDP